MLQNIQKPSVEIFQFKNIAALNKGTVVASIYAMVYAYMLFVSRFLFIPFIHRNKLNIPEKIARANTQEILQTMKQKRIHVFFRDIILIQKSNLIKSL